MNKYTSNSSKRCILEVDLEYSRELRELHNDYPLAVDKIEIKREMVSEYQLKIADLYNIPIGNVRKLVSNVLDKEKYVLHYKNLQLYLRLGLKLKKTRRVLEFNQTQWLKPYIEFNTQKRIEEEKNNGKDGKVLYKLMNKAIYKKTIENLRNRINFKLVSSEKDYLKCTSKRSYMLRKTFGNNLVAISNSKLVLKLNKPAYIGICILELSKILTYKFHYDYMINKYDKKSKLLFTDTDSLIYEIKPEDVYED